jgi:hypothetical protein
MALPLWGRKAILCANLHRYRKKRCVAEGLRKNRREFMLEFRQRYRVPIGWALQMAAGLRPADELTLRLEKHRDGRSENVTEF